MVNEQEQDRRGKSTDMDIDELIRLHTEEDLSGKQCAEKMGCAPSTAIKYLRRRGVYESYK